MENATLTVKPTSNIKPQTSNTFWRVLDLVIGGIFLYAGISKALDPVQFANDIENFHIVPWTVGVRLAFYLPWLEIICGIALILRRVYAGALTVFLVLTLVFMGAIISARARGLDIKCGCFGHAMDNLGYISHLALNLAILAAVAILLRRGFPRRTLP
jgi:putative oxidoreductase